ncbi:Ribosomal protein L32p [Arabidopsis thaliana x Arabidopsis arenosa]|uniref:Ribosomal protein L32p n=1 Tax=Arabidopsis thaliana x Arabidopsis arenosa TaxID=1240361 RepID=A0A8T2BJ08_9BRAS|nr:Ribosomal protein L32p [Arabidopsis thaliana x Arabidopsis arenosa]
MALRLTTLKRAVVESRRILEFRSFSHVSAISPPLNGAIDRSTASPPLVLPEFYQDQLDSSIDDNNFRFGSPSFSFGGSMELMAVPKKKISKHKRGIRNGPKALKPTPVIIRCRSCGRVKLPHFYCCSGERVIPEEQSNSNN